MTHLPVYEPSCTSCDLHEQATSVCIPTTRASDPRTADQRKLYGPWPTREKDVALLVVGEAPGAEEDKLCRPFVGKTGLLLGTGTTGLPGKPARWPGLPARHATVDPLYLTRLRRDFRIESRALPDRGAWRPGGVASPPPAEINGTTYGSRANTRTRRAIIGPPTPTRRSAVASSPHSDTVGIAVVSATTRTILATC